VYSEAGQALHKPDAPISNTFVERARRLYVVESGLVVSLNGLFENALVEFRFGQHLFEAAVLNFQFLQPLTSIKGVRSLFFRRGLPRGRVVLSSESLTAVLLVHFSLPKGVPLTIHFLMADSSASDWGLFTSARQFRGSDGFFTVASHSGVACFCCRAQAEPYSHSSAFLTRFARKGLRST